jgi:hypothetical protein
MKKILLFLLIPFVCFGATELKKVVRQSPGAGEYATLAACLAANGKDLVSSDEYLNIEIDGTWSAVDNAQWDIDGYTTDATRYIKIYTTTAARSTYRSVGNNQTNYIREGFVTFEGITFANENITGAHNFISYIGLTAAVRTVFKKCKFIGHGNANYRQKIWGIISGAAPKQYFINCLLYNFGAYSDSYIAIENATDSLFFYNSAFIAAGTDVTAGLRNDGGALLVAKNSYVANSYSGRNYFGTIALTTCASSDATGDIDNIAYSTDNFTNVTAGSEDFSLPEGSALIDVGTTISESAPLDYSDDYDGTARGATWDVGAFEYSAGGCTPATMPNRKLTANVGDAGLFDLLVDGVFDSIKILDSPLPDSAVLLDYDAKDTVAYRLKGKVSNVSRLQVFSCAGAEVDTGWDTIVAVGDSVRYAARVDTAHISTYFDPTNAFLMSDSVTVKSGMPPGGALTKSGANLGRVTLTTPPDTGHYTPTLICWNNGFKVDSGSFNLTIIYGPVTLDSVSSDTVLAGDTITVYGRHFGTEVDSLSGAMGDSDVVFLGCTNDTVSMIIPDIDTGLYDLILGDGVTADTLVGGIYVDQDTPPELCTLTVATTTGGTVDPSGVVIDTCGDTLDIAATADGGGYAFTAWSCVGAEVVNAFDATTKAYLTSGSGTVTALFDCTGATIAYTPTTYVCTLGVELIPLVPVIAGDYTAVTVSPPLPAGISMSSVTGAVTGTPTIASGATSYVFSFSGNCNPGSDTINISTLLIKDTMVSCYPRKVRSDVVASLRIITMKYHGIFKATENTIVHLGSVSLGPNTSYTDSTVVDTVFGCPSGYYRGFLTDPAYTDMSDTVLNVLQVLTPTGTVTNPR